MSSLHSKFLFWDTDLESQSNQEIAHKQNENKSGINWMFNGTGHT